MAYLGIDLNAYSPELRRSLNGQVRRAAEKGWLGVENASRLIAFAGDALSDQTYELLGEIGEENWPPQHVEPILPILRVGHDFEPAQIVHYQLPERNAAWCADQVFAIEDPHDEEGSIPIGERGAITIVKTPDDFDEDHAQFVDAEESGREFGPLPAYVIPPDWPALMTHEMYVKLMLRKSEENDARKSGDSSKANERLFVSGWGRFFLESTYFQADASPRHRAAARHALRHFALKVPDIGEQD